MVTSFSIGCFGGGQKRIPKQDSVEDCLSERNSDSIACRTFKRMSEENPSREITMSEEIKKPGEVQKKADEKAAKKQETAKKAGVNKKEKKAEQKKTAPQKTVQKKPKKAAKAPGKKPKQRLITLLLMISVVPLILSIAIVSVVSISLTRSNLNKASREKLFVAANNLANHCMQYHIGMKNANQYYDYLDSLKERGIQMTIFIGDTLCVSSIKNENDYRVREIPFNSEDYQEYYDDNVIIEGITYCGYYVPFVSDDGNNCYALAAETAESITAASRKIMVNLLVIAVAFSVVFAFVTIYFSRKLLAGFKDVEKNVNALSEGNLAEQKMKESSIRELDELLTVTSAVQKNLANVIGNVKSVATDLVSGVEEATNLTDSTYSRANQIDEVVSNLTDATTAMTDNVQDINTQVIEIENVINEIYSNVDSLHSNSESMQKVNSKTHTEMITIKENSDRSVEAVKNIAGHIKETNNSISEIGTAVDLIISISDQTNLLSLNASIEAARAGEFGRGFAVVAEEIRSLSVQSADGAEVIRNLAQKITDESRKTVSLAGQVLGLIEEGGQKIGLAQSQYEELSSKINQSVEEIRILMKKADELTEYKDVIVANVHDLSAISEENAASHQEVNANITEIVSEVRQVNDDCKSMNLMAKDLQKAVEYFKN